MRVVCWNVNGLRACLKNSGGDLRSFLDSLRADIICLQEIKATRDQLDASTYAAKGYSAYFSFCRVKGGYSGVVTFCCSGVGPVAAEEGITGILSTDRQDAVGCNSTLEDLTDEEFRALDAEGRAVLTEFSCGEGERVVVVNVYCPMVDAENMERMEYKLRFYRVLRERCTALERAGKFVIVVGDLNCSREAIDSAYILEDPRMLEGSPSRESLLKFTVSNLAEVKPSSSFQLVDVFRHLHPTQMEAYTCWSTITDARKTNYGTRIDYILASPALVKLLTKCEVWQHVEGSDHCPVFAEFSLTISPSAKPPSLCSDYFQEFRLMKLSAFLTVKDKGSLSKGPSSENREGGEESAATTTVDSKRTLKRSSNVEIALPPKARRGSQLTSAKPQTLLSFFGKNPPQSTSEQELETEPEGKREIQQEESENTPQEAATNSPQLSSVDEPPSSPPRLSEAWKSVFSAPKPPLCSGHQEPSVLRTVKKPGPNRFRQFWVCARPSGSKDNPLARCNFFKWVAKK